MKSIKRLFEYVWPSSQTQTNDDESQIDHSQILDNQNESSE